MTGDEHRAQRPPGAPGEAEYRAEHLRAVLAADPRVHELGLDVAVLGDTIVLRGTVATPAMKAAVGEVAHEFAPDAVIVNDVEVPPNPEPDTVEELD